MGFGLNPGIPGAGDTELATEAKQDAIIAAIQESYPSLAVRLDDSNDPILYIGKASIGSATSSSVWQIAKLDTSSGLIKTWADGDSLFNNKWDDRASLTYN